jgi:hypothetical protein
MSLYIAYIFLLYIHIYFFIIGHMSYVSISKHRYIYYLYHFTHIDSSRTPTYVRRLSGALPKVLYTSYLKQKGTCICMGASVSEYVVCVCVWCVCVQV